MQLQMESQKKTKVRIFLARLLVYIVSGLIIPVTFLIARFNLFTEKMNVGIWGVITIILTAVFLYKLAAQAEKCIDSIQGRQVVHCIRKIFIPFLAIALVIFGMEKFLDDLVWFFVILAFFETVAGIFNPFPEYIKEQDEKNKDKKEDSKMLKFAKIFWSAKE